MKKIELENFSMILNCDRSVLDLNPTLSKSGYILYFYSWKELEVEFNSFFSYIVNSTQIPEEPNDLRSFDFNESVIKIFGVSYIMYEGIVLLKSPIPSYKIVEKGGWRNYDQENSFGKLVTFTKELVQQLRLVEAGPIMSGPTFSRNEESKIVYTTLLERNYTLNLEKTFKIDQRCIGQFDEIFKVEFRINDLCKLAFNSFELAYSLENPQTRFVTLMTALESLFNQGRDQFTHIVSRHLALIIANDRIEFQEHYKAIKKLYGVRSAIVHGQELKKVNLGQECSSLEEYVRKALNYCLKLDITRKQLFEELNAKGF